MAQKNKSSDYLRVTMGVIITLILGGFLIPLVRLLPTPALMGSLLAPIYTICSYLTLEAINLKHGIVLFGTLLGLILSVFMPYIFLVTIASALIATVFFKKSAHKAVVFSSAQFNLMLPLIMSKDAPGFLVISILGFVTSVILSILGLLLAKHVKPRILQVVRR